MTRWLVAKLTLSSRLACLQVCIASRAQHTVVYVCDVCRVRAAGPQIGALLQGAAELALMLSAASSGIMGISVAVVELKRGAHTTSALSDTIIN